MQLFGGSAWNGFLIDADFLKIVVALSQVVRLAHVALPCPEARTSSRRVVNDIPMRGVKMSKSAVAALSLWLLAWCTVLWPVKGDLPSTERQALLDLYSSTGGLPSRTARRRR